MALKRVAYRKHGFFQGYRRFTKGKQTFGFGYDYTVKAGSPGVTGGRWALMQIHPGQQLGLLMSVTQPKPQQTQNPPIRIVLTETKGPSS